MYSKLIRNALFVFLIAFALSTMFLLLVRRLEIDREFARSKVFFQKSTEFLAHSISLGYFQWTEMYEAFLEHDNETIEEYFSQLREDFPQVLEIVVTPAVVREPAKFQISSEANLLAMVFPIFDSDGERFIQDRVVLIKIDPAWICEFFNIENITFSADGKEFAFGSKAKYSGEVFRSFHLGISLMIATLVASVSFTLSFRHMYRVQLGWSEKYKRKFQALQSILMFMDKFLRTRELSETVDFQEILEDAVKIVPGAEAGSIILEEDGEYAFKAAVGYSLKELSKVRLKADLLNRKVNDETVVVKNLGELDKKALPAEQFEIMDKAGAIQSIKATLSVPIVFQGGVIGYFNLDSFSSEEAFNEESVEIAKIFADEVSLLLERWTLEQRIKLEHEKVEELYKLALRRATALNSIIDFMQRLLGAEIKLPDLNYQEILKTAVKTVPGAQAGSLIMREGEFFVYKAAAGYNLEEIEKVQFDSKTVYQLQGTGIKIIKGWQEHNSKHLSKQDYEILQRFGKIEEIKVSLSIPVVVDGQVSGFMVLDNFESDDAFNEESIQIGQLFSNIVGVLLDRFGLEMQLVKEKEVANELFKQAMRRSAALRTMLDLMQRLLRTKIDSMELSYQEVLEAAVKTVSGAQAGLLTLKEGDFLIFKAAVGYELSELEKVRLDLRKQPMRFNKQVLVVKQLRSRSAEVVSEEELEILVKRGRINEIKCSLRLPLIVGDEVLGVMYLDNFESEEAFDEESVQIAQLFSNIAGVLLNRLMLENQLEAEKRQLEFLSRHDTLTQLPNRRYLIDLAETMLALAKRERVNVSVLYLDLLKFKRINDTFGHYEGDQVLKVVAQRMKNFLRRSDVVGRIGGDEFVVIAYNTDVEKAQELAKRLIEIIEEPINTDSYEHLISANIGIAEFPKDGEDLDELIQKADQTMYVAKTNNVPYLTTDALQDLK